MTAPNLTPAEALAMFKDWEDSALTIYDFRHKWYVSNDPDSFALIAIAALETLLSEHEATKAKLAAYEAKEPAAAPESVFPDGLMQSIEEHRKWAQSVRDADAEKLHKLMARQEPAAAVPSDAELRELLGLCQTDLACSGYTFNLLRHIVQRIGVKL